MEFSERIGAVPMPNNALSRRKKGKASDVLIVYTRRNIYVLAKILIIAIFVLQMQHKVFYLQL